MAEWTVKYSLAFKRADTSGPSAVASAIAERYCSKQYKASVLDCAAELHPNTMYYSTSQKILITFM
jgi:hypothetical protein